MEASERASVASGKAPRRIIVGFCNLLRDVRDEKKSIMISGCQKCQSKLARTWFSHCSLLFPEDFAMDEDQKPTTLRDFRDRLFERTAQWLFCWRQLLFRILRGKQSRDEWFVSFISGVELHVLRTYRKPFKREKPRQIFSNRYIISECFEAHRSRLPILTLLIQR